MILNRTQFAIHFNNLQPGLGNRSSALWSPEEYLRVNKSVAFVCVKPINVSAIGKVLYWNWCKKHLQGKVACYSSDDINEEEWWGFTNPDDIVFWMLRWAN